MRKPAPKKAAKKTTKKKASKRASTARRRKAAPKPAEVKVTAAKGRPMLTWVGKRPLSRVTAFPAQHIETFDPAGSLRKPTNPGLWKDWPDAYPPGGLLFHGDNKEILAHLLANGFRGKVDLIYIDPPFDSGADYVRKVSLRGATGSAKLDGEEYTLGEQVQYRDIWANDNYLQFMYERLLLLKELLAEDGTMYLHCDWHRGHHLRCLLDEVFGESNFRNEIVWYYSGGGASKEEFASKHDTIYAYKKGEQVVFNVDEVRMDYKWVDGQRRADGSERDLARGKLPDDVMGLDIVKLNKIMPWSEENTGFPTQKNEAVAAILSRASSHPGDVILDCFIGSGTVAAAAQRLGRRWIGCDINKGAIQTTSKRLQSIIEDQRKRHKQGKLSGVGDEGGPTPPAQLGLSVWRVNDYDLTIQHNEAVNLACEHVGVQTTRSDTYFDGTRGNALVKIIPFNRPLTPLDLEELKRELAARPEEDRAITLICLGIETAALAWIEDWNRLRKGKNAVNRLAVIELRTDPKYGKFFQHKPAVAKVSIARKKDKLLVEVDDFISPTIIERLDQQAGVVKPKIEDWRAMVDCVLIDTAYDGEVFNIALSDIPEKKTDLVSGHYELPAPKGKTTVAVKIIDMLGEESLTTATV